MVVVIVVVVVVVVDVVVVVVVVVVEVVDVVVVGFVPKVTGSEGQHTSGKKPEKLHTEALKYLMTSVGIGFLSKTIMFLHFCSPMHSPSFPWGVVHLFSSSGKEGLPKLI